MKALLSFGFVTLLLFVGCESSPKKNEVHNPPIKISNETAKTDRKSSSSLDDSVENEMDALLDDHGKSEGSSHRKPEGSSHRKSEGSSHRMSEGSGSHKH